MQTLRARCRWVPHERMVVDALTKRRGNSITMLRQLRDGALSIVDEDQELAMRKTFRETHKGKRDPVSAADLESTPAEFTCSRGTRGKSIPLHNDWKGIRLMLSRQIQIVIQF